MHKVFEKTKVVRWRDEKKGACVCMCVCVCVCVCVELKACFLGVHTPPVDIHVLLLASIWWWRRKCRTGRHSCLLLLMILAVVAVMPMSWLVVISDGLAIDEHLPIHHCNMAASWSSCWGHWHRCALKWHVAWRTPTLLWWLWRKSWKPSC